MSVSLGLGFLTWEARALDRHRAGYEAEPHLDAEGLMVAEQGQRPALSSGTRAPRKVAPYPTTAPAGAP